MNRRRLRSRLRSRRLVVVVPLLWPILVPVAGLAAGTPPFTRTLEVLAPGTVEVALDLAALRHSRPGGDDLRVFDPTGAEVALGVRAVADADRVRSASLDKVEEEGPGWWIYLDAGRSGEPHRGLQLETAGARPQPGSVLEASVDGAVWRGLSEWEPPVSRPVEGPLALAYAATTERHLRLWWPHESGFPRVGAALLEPVGRFQVEQTGDHPECRPLGSVAVSCGLELLAPGGRRLTVRISGQGRVGVRLSRAEGGRWAAVSEGTFESVDSGAAYPRVLDLPEGPAGPLRVELFGSAEARPVLLGYSVEYPVRVVRFEAATAGTYTLGYGGERRQAAATGWPSVDPVSLQRPVLGLERDRPRPPLPAVATAPGAPVLDPFDASWRVVAPGVIAGNVVRLELPGGVYRASRRALEDVRLVYETNQVPYLLRRLAEPEIVPVEVTPAPGTAAASSSRSLLELDLAPASGTFAQVVLTDSARPFRRRVRARFLGPGELAPGGVTLQAPEWSIGWRPWVCAASPAAPCSIDLQAFVPEAARLRVEIDGVGEAATVSLAAQAFRPRDELVFVWPEAEELRLSAGNRQMAAPGYDLALLAEDILGRPWVEARIESSEAGDRGSAALNRLVLVGLLGLVAALLFVAFLRWLPRRDGE